jgi:hypothetical protein
LEDHHSQLLLNNNITLMNSQLDWDEFETVLPDVTDIETLASLAMMTNNAYTLPGDDRWYDPGGAWNLVSTCNPLISVFLGINGNLPFFPTYLSLPFVQSDSFGWEEDGLRGHVFATPDNSTVVIAIKGTSAGLLGNGGSTGVNDKLNVRAHHPEKKKSTVPFASIYNVLTLTAQKINCRTTYSFRVAVQESVGAGRQFVTVTRGRISVAKAVWKVPWRTNRCTSKQPWIFTTTWYECIPTRKFGWRATVWVLRWRA